MAHELTLNKNGQHEMMYIGEKPWHGLGQKLDKPATAEEAITAANLNWNVTQEDVLINNSGTLAKVPSYKAVVREDNRKVLSIMKETYKPVQNIEAFAFFDSVVGTGQAIYDTAGSIFEGRKIFLVAKLPEELKATDSDKIEQYLTLMNSHDGSSALRMYFSPVRVVCNNTLNASIRTANESISIYHRGSIENKIIEAQQALGLARRWFADFQDIVNRFVQKKLDSQMVEGLINSILEVTPNENGETSNYKKKQIETILNNYYNDPKNNLNGIIGSAWSLYNAVTQYADHQNSSVIKSADNRFNSIISGTSAQLKQNAMNAILTVS